MKIALVGGGTMGSVSPLIAIAQYLFKNNYYQTTDFIWIGSKKGPERKVVTNLGWQYQVISAGKWRRYFSVYNFLDLFQIMLGFFQSLWVIRKENIKVMVTAGSYLAIPFYLAAKLSGVKIIVHQLDLQVGLANKIMSRGADQITVSWPELLKKFKNSAIYIGTPIRNNIITSNESDWQHKLATAIGDRVVILITGGGTGSVQLNDLVDQTLGDLVKQGVVIHLTGAAKSSNRQSKNNSYFVYDFLDEEQMGFVLRRASLVITRGGIGALSELIALKKKILIIPLPNSHQEENAKYFNDRGLAQVIYSNQLTKELFLTKVEAILSNAISASHSDLVQSEIASEKIANIIKSYDQEKLVKN